MDDAKSSDLREDDIAGSAVAEYVLNVTVEKESKIRGVMPWAWKKKKGGGGASNKVGMATDLEFGVTYGRALSLVEVKILRHPMHIGAAMGRMG
ncbi:hypothetical protein HZ326_21427 [Fusarium oxysporum f. sp. albedinis]|nr:hypothetical protein HZ326_21427 [Fusarium oxysporum f. sp. albedinis]